MHDDIHPSSFRLERLLAGELDAGAQGELRAHLASCPSCQDKTTALEQDRAAFAAEVPFGAFRARHEEKKARRKSFFRLTWAMPTLTTAAALAGALLVIVGTEPDVDTPNDIRLKGDGVTVSFTVQEPGGQTHLGSSGERLERGTAMQLAYDAGENTHVALLGLDSSGQVTVYFPEGGLALARVPAGSQGPFPFSLTLAPEIRGERFFAVYARGPEKLAPIVEAARRLATKELAHATSLELPFGVAQSSFYVTQR